MKTVRIVSTRHTVYSRARVITTIELTPRIQQLIDLGVFTVIDGPTPIPAPPKLSNLLPLPVRSELVEQASGLGISIKPAWSPLRIRREIEETLGRRRLEDG